MTSIKRKILNKNKTINMKRSIIILAIIAGFVIIATGQQGRKIEIEFDGIKDSVLYLVHYYGNSNTIADTAYQERSGKYVFSGKRKLPAGVYILVDENKSRPYFEFLIDKDQRFKIKTDTIDIYGNITFRGSPLNNEFRDYSIFITEKRKSITSIRGIIDELRADSLKNNEEEISKLTKQIKDINKTVRSHQEEIVARAPNSLLAILLKLQWDPEHPYDLKNGTKEDSLNAYYYVRDHFWDHVDLSDERVVRTPIFHERLRTYMTSLVVQHPDSVIEAGERIISQTVSAPELYKFVVWYIVNTTERSNIMGMEKAFVHFARKYYLGGKTWWASDAVIKRMAERVRILERILIGEIAPELQMWDTNKVVTSLHRVKADYTILIFWDYDCGHCGRVLEPLRDYYHTVKDKGVEVFAVCTKSDLDKWKDYIVERNLNWINVNGSYSVNRYDTLYDIMATPVIFLLDKDKRILAKKLELEQLKEIISMEMEKARKQNGKRED